ncbi:hypothetical protein KDX16_33625 [Burkholderia vietnamiensis]|uniref:Uncharacterized protein n=2 Tax=Burkholderia cepacia complex TaxID=87882 RepID=A0AAP4R9P5_9BURK|nr:MULTISPECIES: hypothetical protein [Burkholderia]HDR9758763.1 hypothetical protein [Burkholderia cepacia ATCC 25416]MBR7920743.1 hypothetical protein [Burkholderia vietnamiensis]MBR8054832.1 hypothetical protein [Burkholderia vietnamiensis]MDN7570094.1 hypothetical protein [Burkholderia contaminans]VWC52283.1 hypothetical protein BLA13014_07949 [Burkholderia aenigmatica]
MTKQKRPFKFNFHSGDVGHTLVIGSISNGKTAPADLVKLGECGHPGGKVSVEQAGTLVGSGPSDVGKTV